MALIDSHAHLTYDELYSQIDDVLARCAAAGVDHVITVGTSPPDIDRALALAVRFTGRVSVAAAIHPHHAAEVSPADLDALAQTWHDPRVVALGEMGLDYHYDFADRGVQRDVFAVQLARARPLDKPLVLHSREALDDTIGLLLDHGFENRPAVFHCFTGTAEEAARIAAHGWRISFTGIVTFRKSQWLQEIARAYPADQLMVETDAPYLSPEPFRGQRPCEPAYVAHTARFLADLRGEAFEQFVVQTAHNTQSFFQLF